MRRLGVFRLGDLFSALCSSSVTCVSRPLHCHHTSNLTEGWPWLLEGQRRQSMRQVRNLVPFHMIRDRELQTARPTESWNPKTPKVHLKVRKIPCFGPPEKWPPKSSKMSRKPIFLGIKLFKNRFFGHLLGPCLRGVQDGIFRTLKCTFGVQGSGAL